MNQHDDHDTEVISSILFRDVLTLALGVFVILVVVMYTFLNPTTQQAETDKSQGNIMIEIDWSPDVDADIDLWVLAPGDMPVGYSNKGALYFDLVRDDLGKYGDMTGYNHEVAFSRGLPDGEYVVNIHAFRNKAGMWPVEVAVAATVAPDMSKSERSTVSTRASLFKEGEEITAMAFTVRNKVLDHESVNHVFVPLRSYMGTLK